MDSREKDTIEYQDQKIGGGGGWRGQGGGIYFGLTLSG